MNRLADTAPEGIQKLLTDFLARWPLESLNTMTLAEYNTAGSKDCFTYWLEDKTRAIGSIKGGSAFKFGVFGRKDREDKTDGRGRRYSGTHGWYGKYGDSAEEAFETVRSLVVEIAQAARSGNFEKIDTVELGEAVRWKIAFIYQDHTAPRITNFFKGDMLRALVGKPGISLFDAHQALMAERGDTPVFVYGKQLLDQLRAQGYFDSGEDSDEVETDNEDERPRHMTSPDHIPLNQILYGPPGTGKTWATTEMAVSIADPAWMADVYADLDVSEQRAALKARYRELLDEQRIVFTTFHQSYAYEDFVEGIRPETHPETGALSYTVADGVFKALVEAAQSQVVHASSDTLELKGRRIWKMSLGNTLTSDNEIFEECLEEGYVLLGYGGDTDYSACTDRQAVKSRYEQSVGKAVDNNDYTVTAVNQLKNSMQRGDLIVVSDGNHKFRAIAEVTGEYARLDSEDRDRYVQMRPVRWLTQFTPSLPKERLFKKALSQMTLYELKPGTIDHSKLEQLLTPHDTTSAAPLPHVMIIDEINRGNVSRVFGELITLLEPSKRIGADDEQLAKLPYSKTVFGIPGNVYVIGTMNTADRSLAQIDLALRRRFEFREVPPNAALLQGTSVHGVNLADLLTSINERITVLLDSEHTVGHAYFLPVANADNPEQALAEVFQRKLLPLLQEYFFDDLERIGWVLNDPAKAPEHRFIQAARDTSGATPLAKLFPADVAEQLNDRRYRININALSAPEAYAGIVA